MRTQLSRSVTALTVASLSFVLPVDEGNATGPSTVAPETVGATVDATALPAPFADTVEWAVSLFGQAELELPPLRFEHHGDDREPCGGWMGVHRFDGERSTIGLCVTEVTPHVEATVLHETAHAWAAHSLTDERIAEFQQLRGWEEWRADKWHHSGSEQAAEILMWGLIDRPIGIVTINDHTCDALEAGYRTLTGQEPLHGFRDHC